MTLSSLFAKLFKWSAIIALVVMVAAYAQKDTLPTPDYYGTEIPGDPLQSKTHQQPFETEVNDERYLITPKFDYELEGIVVSAHDSDAFSDIWHHDKWRDFLNVRDLCVIWGSNLSSGVYKEMDFTNDSWTCWAYWPNAAVGQRFSMSQLSNNHLLTDNAEINEAIMAAEPGDHIWLKGLLAGYANPANGFHRGTSTVRTDTGNGACETIYVKEFEIINRANPAARRLFTTAKWIFLGSILGGLLLFFITPVRRQT